MPDYSKLISKSTSSPKDFFEETLSKAVDIKVFYEKNDIKKIKSSPFKIPTLGLIDPKKKVKKAVIKEAEKDKDGHKDKDKETKTKVSSKTSSKKEGEKKTESSVHKTNVSSKSSRKEEVTEDKTKTKTKPPSSTTSLHKKDKVKTNVPLNSLLKGKSGSFLIHSSMFSLEEGGECEFYIVKKLKLDQDE